MNYSTFKTRLLLSARNLKSTHPVISNTNGGGDYINEGLRFMILRASQKFPNFELFPEHKDVEWTDVTLADQNYLVLPIDQIVVQRAYSLDSATSPDLNNSDWRVLNFIEPQAFDQLEKPTTTLAYPTLYTLRENRIYFHPTPRTTKTTYIKIDGIQDEPNMSAPTDTPRTNVRWHPAIVACSSYLMMTDLGWHDDAAKQLQKADEMIATVAGSMVGLRKAGYKKTIRVAGMPKGVF